jgi:hypothetical protein
MQTVVETRAFISAADDAGLTEEERDEIKLAIAINPALGDIMVGTGGARKFRWAGRGRGKSGGYRVVSYFGGGDIPVFLLSVFSKGERANLNAADKQALRTVTAELARYGKASR